MECVTIFLRTSVFFKTCNIKIQSIHRFTGGCIISIWDSTVKYFKIQTPNMIY